jgi:hypothetical protein
MRIAGIILLAVTLATPAFAAGARYACPATKSGQPLVSHDVFDGPVADEAALAPDSGSQTNGVWTFEGTYEDGRFITLRCNYADGAATDITMKQKVKACMARTMGKTLSVTCN